MRNQITLQNFFQDRSVVLLSVLFLSGSVIAFINESFFIGIVLFASVVTGILAPITFLSRDKKVPNLLSALNLTFQEESSKELLRSCSICGIGDCQRQSSHKGVNNNSHSHINFNIPQSVDDALEELFNVILDQYVYSWYREISAHDQLADEIRYIIRYAAASVGLRLSRIDLSQIILEKLIPASICYLDAYIQGKQENTTNDETATLQYIQKAGFMHRALKSRVDEADYLRSIVHELFPYLLPANCQESKLGKLFLGELLGRFLILQGMDLLADPDTVNLLFLFIFSAPKHEPWDEPMQEPTKLILKNFSHLNNHPRKSSCRSELAVVLKNQWLFYLFQDFLKKEGGLNVLQFYMTVEDFNRHVKPKDLSDEELQDLHKEALGLYHTYMAPSAIDKIPLKLDIIDSIKQIVHSSPDDSILKLHTTRPLFQAYEYAYHLLEKEFLPLFFGSTAYFAYFCGDRQPASPQKQCASVSPSRSRECESGGLHIGSMVKKVGSGLKSFGKHIILRSYVVNGDEEFKITDQVDEAVDISTFLMGDSRGGLEGLAHCFGDMSTYNVTIPKVESGLENSGKRSFVFLVNVRRIQASKGKDNISDQQWQVERRYHEFYILEAKLTEFHGEFLDIWLPPRRSLFLSRGIDFMLSRRKTFEEYLQKLVRQPSLKNSQLLFLFLKNTDEFIPNDLLELSFSRFLRDVPRKLVKEKGQYLDVFIDKFISTASNVNKTSLENEEQMTDVPTSIFDLQDTELLDHLYGNNAGFLSQDVEECLPCAIDIHGVTEIVLCIAVKAYGLSMRATSWLRSFIKIFGTTIDAGIKLFLKSKLDLAIAAPRLVLLIHLIRDVIFVPPPPVLPEESHARRISLLNELIALIPPWLRRLLFTEKSYRQGAETLVSLFQNPLLNKQLSYVLLDIILEELFPEMQAKVNIQRNRNL